MAKKRNGIFRVAMRAHAERLAALKQVGMPWSMIASHFWNDEALGCATGNRFANEWGVLRQEGLQIDPVRVESLVEHIKSLKDISGLWVTIDSSLPRPVQTGIPRHPPQRGETRRPLHQTVQSPAQPEPEPLDVRSEQPSEEKTTPPATIMPEGSVVERHQLAAAAAGMPSTFPIKSSGQQNPVSTVPITWKPSGPVYEMTPEHRFEFENKLKKQNLMARDIKAHFDFSPAVIDFAIVQARHVRGMDSAFDLWVGRLAFCSLIERNEIYRGEIARLPGFERWQAARQNGAIIFEKALAWLQQHEKQQ